MACVCVYNAFEYDIQKNKDRQGAYLGAQKSEYEYEFIAQKIHMLWST